jgi:chaperonin GroEL
MQIEKQKLFESVKKVVDVITSTMGPGGTLVGIRSNFENVYQQTRDLNKESGVLYREDLLTKDGVTVARFTRFTMSKIADTSSFIDDKVNSFIASMVCEAANKMMTEIGDGTTTVSLMVKAIFEQVLILAECKDVNWHQVRDGMDYAVKEFQAAINEIKKEVVLSKGDGYNRDYLKGIATISANNNERLGELVAKVVAAVGINGSIRLMDSPSDDEYFVKTDGYTYPAGVWAESQLVGEEGGLKQEVKLGKHGEVMVLMINKKIDTIEMLNPVIDAWIKYCSQKGKISIIATGSKTGNNAVDYAQRIDIPLVLLVSDIEGSAFTTLQLNLTKGTHPVYLVKMAYQGQDREDLLNDLNQVVGSHQVFSVMSGRDISRFGKDFPEGQAYSEFGFVQQVILTKEKLVFIPFEDVMDKQVAPYVQELKRRQLNDFTQERIARLSCGIAQLFLTAETAAELGDKRELADDAIRACMSAIKYGVVAGGGRAMHYVQKIKAIQSFGDLSYEIGFRAVWNSLSAPMLKIVDNCGNLQKFNIEKLNDKAETHSIDPRTLVYKDFFAAGILDPAYMPISAIRNAVSIVGQLMKMNYFIDAKL